MRTIPDRWIIVDTSLCWQVSEIIGSWFFLRLHLHHESCQSLERHSALLVPSAHGLGQGLQPCCQRYSSQMIERVDVRSANFFVGHLLRARWQCPASGACHLSIGVGARAPCSLRVLPSTPSAALCQKAQPRDNTAIRGYMSVPRKVLGAAMV